MIYDTSINSAIEIIAVEDNNLNNEKSLQKKKIIQNPLQVFQEIIFLQI